MSSKAASSALAPLAAAEARAISEIATFVTKRTGVVFDRKHESMLRSRLASRLSELGLRTFAEYADRLRARPAEEEAKLVGLLTTHHTYFFREFAHFEHLAEKALPELVARARAQNRKSLKLWSAACSRGHEAYSLAMWMRVRLAAIAPDMSFEILATDVDPDSVKVAGNGVYKFAELKEVPLSLMNGAWARGTGDIKDFVKAKKELRERCRFEVENLLEIKRPATEKFDVVFCRNVFIYFPFERAEAIARELLARTIDGGFLYVGISESLHGAKLPAQSVGPSIYQKSSPAPKVAAVATAPRPSLSPAAPVAAGPAPLIRVFCVDDSPSVLKLLARVFTPENGFELAGQAINGRDAFEKLKLAGRVDAMTLDIHMPEQDGIAYLRERFGASHPPVVMVTSASRESSGLALQALKLGASDFVEKPALTSLQERADELRMKVKLAARSKTKHDASLDRSFGAAKPPAIPSPGSKLIAFAAFGLEPLPRVISAVRQSVGSDLTPPAVFIIDAPPAALDAFRSKLEKESRYALVDAATPGELKPGQAVVLGWTEGLEALSRSRARQAAALCFGDFPAAQAERLQKAASAFSASAFFLEDLGEGRGAAALASRAKDVVPATSFPILAAAWLCEFK